MQPSVMMVRSLSSSTTGPTASWLLAAMMPEKKSIFSTSFIRLTSFTEASGPAASSAVIVSIRRRPRSPPAALISSEARVCPLSEGAPSTAPGPERIVMCPNLTGVSGTWPRGDSWAAGAATSPSVTAPTVTPSEARKVRRSTVVLMGVPLPGRRGASPHRHVDRVNAIPPHCRLRAPMLVGGAALGPGVGEVDAGDPLDGVGSEEARHHGADGEAMLGGEGGAVHLPGEEDRARPRDLEGNVLDVALARRSREGAVIRRLEP